MWTAHSQRSRFHMRVWAATHSSNTINNGTTINCLITNDDETPTESPDILVPGQPPSQSEQNKWANCGLQEATEKRTYPHHHQVSSFRFLRLHINKDLTWTRHHRKDTETTALANPNPPQAEEAQHGLQDTLQLQQVHNWEYPDWLHYRLVWQLHCPNL